MALGYYSGGSDTCFTVRENRAFFSSWKILPRMLVDVSNVDMRTNLLGMALSCPILVAPMAMHGLADPLGREVATCLGARDAGVPFVFSTVATSSMQEIADTGHTQRIFQLYVIRDRGVVARWVAAAERVGFTALMVTVDAQRLGRREADERNRFSLPPGLRLKNLEELSSDEVTQARSAGEGSGLMKLFGAQVDASLTWSFIPWLRSITRLPILIKGILHPADAELALLHGVDGIVVSNHGGRQMDYAPSALEMLPAIAAVVRGRVPLLMDGGVRRGTDVLKALALGAQAVLLGRPVLYALALRGRAGVAQALRMLAAELELAMALAGCPTLAHITPSTLLRNSTYCASHVSGALASACSGGACCQPPAGCGSSGCCGIQRPTAKL